MERSGLSRRSLSREAGATRTGRHRPEDDVAPQLGGTEWLRVEPRGRPAGRGHVQTFERDVQTFEHGHLAELPEPRADLI
jgi:hypothetical protein